MKIFLFFYSYLLFVSSINAQEKSPVKFGKISADDFKTTVYSIDSNATAVVIADIGSSQIIGNTKGWFSIEFKHFKRVHILKKSAYDLADVQIPLYTNGDAEEQLQNLKAYTYNLESGKVVETKLDVKSSVFKDKLSKNQVIKKFTFPAIKEGSIIEFEYTINSDFLFNLQPWEFQGAYPQLWSEYEVSIPDFLYYVFLTQGYQQIQSKQNSRQEQYRISDNRGAGASDRYEFTARVTDYRMVLKNVPALKEESFTSTLDNHISKVEFQLAEYRYPLSPKNIMGNWVTVCEQLIKDEDFGLQLNRDNGWMNDDIKLLLKDASTSEQKARNIYQYIQSNFTCTDHHRLHTDQALKKILSDKKGSEAEINLLLVAMLRKAGLNADPVMLSTKSHGYALSLYPIMDRFNYVVCCATIDDRPVFLDASQPRLGFGRLHWECYNGHARIINQQATPLELVSDSLKETKITSLMLFNDDKDLVVGTMSQLPGYYESFSLRNRINEKGQEELFKDIKKDFGTDVEITNTKIDSLEKFDYPIQLSYNVKLNWENEDMVYLNPMFGEGYKENPFKSPTRSYPVEMPYAFDEIYLLRMDVPARYEVEELPKSTRVNFDDTGNSFYEYLIVNSGGVISLRSRIKLARSYYLPEEYEILREFFSLVVSKQNEQIVFKKKK